MTLRNNLQDQLNYLSEHLSECQFSGFQYAPTASSDITTPTIFSFETRESNNSKSSSVQSVSNVGFLELQSFRAENSSGRPVPSISTTLTSISSYTTEASSAKYTSVVPEAPRRIEEIRPPVRNNYEPSRPLNIQDEISKFESAIPDSALMEIDIDALVEAELAKSTQKTVSLQTNISNYVSNSSITGTGTGSGLHAQQGDRYSGSRSSAQQPTNNTNNSYNSYNNNNSYNNGTRSSYVQDLSPAARSVTAQPYGGSSGGSSGVGGSGGGTGTGTAPASGLRAESTGGGNSAAGKQAESQHLQREMDRLMRELGAVNAQLAESLQQNGFYPVPLKKQRAALEEEVEEVALQQHRLLQSSNGNSGGNGGGSSSKETAADVIDLCSAVKSTAYASNYSNAPYSVPNSTTANSNGYYSGGGGGSGGGGVSSGLGNSQQLSPQLAAVSRLATSGDTPIAVHSYNSNFTRSAAAVAYTGNSAAAAAYGGGYGSNDNNNINFGGAGNSGGYVSHSMAGAGSTGNNSNNNRYNPSTYPPTSSAYANGSSGGTGASFAHYAGSGAGAAAAAASAGVPVLSKTSAFARDEFDPDFEDAVNDNDFTDWAVGGPTQQDYHQGGGGSGNSGGGGGAAAVAYQGFGGGGGGDDEFGDNGASDYAAAGGGGRGSYGGGGQGSAYNNNSNYTNSNNSTNYGAGGSSSSHRSPTAVLDNVPLPLCHCGNLTILCTSRTEATRGLKFFSCTGTRGTDAHCGFFQWEDPTLAPDNSNNFNNSNGMYQNGVQGGGGDQVVKDHTVEIQERFGHVGFRQGQLGCVEAALSGKDVFCLMPTGGGKSVVYQLPAWCTPGIAVIFSPLISLIQDQVDSMNAIGIRAVFMSSLKDGLETQELMKELNAYSYSNNSYTRYSTNNIHDEEARIKMLYITPEKFSQSEWLKGLFTKLARANLLSRFIIDEAHCLSQWGHDFRPDYLKLSQIRSLYPNVPLMALTATANHAVVQDCMRILQMKNPYLHSQSFNRSNLRYSIRRKESDKKTVQEIGDFVLKHRKQSGIIYCLSRKDTQALAEELQKVIPSMKREITFYHADLPANEKEGRQRAWSKGDVKLICATIAFGMGINKPDVRYVIHHSLPKSLTNYYQESGRAGRDGETSHCVLYYAFKDRTKLAHMIHKSAEERGRSAGSNDNIRRQLENLNKCVQYCIDEVQCRRVMLLEYFGEKFPRSQCDGTCDNCKHYKDTGAAPPAPQDLTIHAKALLHLTRVATEQGNRLTLIKLARYYGRAKDKESAKTAEILDRIDLSKVPELAAAEVPLTLNKDLTERLLQHMVVEDYLQEVHIANFGNYGADYISEGEHGRKLLPPVTPMGRYGYGAPAASNVTILLPTVRTRKNDGIEGMLPASASSAPAAAPKAGKSGKQAAVRSVVPNKSGRGGYSMNSVEDLNEEEADWLDARSSINAVNTSNTSIDKPAKRARKSKGTTTAAAEPAAATKAAKGSRAAASAASTATTSAAGATKSREKKGQTAVTARQAQPVAPAVSAVGDEDDEIEWQDTQPSINPATAAAAGRGKLATARTLPASSSAAPASKGLSTKAVTSAPKPSTPIDLMDTDEDKPLSALASRKKTAAMTSAYNVTAAAAAGPASKKFKVPYAQQQNQQYEQHQQQRHPSPDLDEIRSDDSTDGRGRGGGHSTSTKKASSTTTSAAAAATSEDDIYDVEGSTDDGSTAGLFDRRRARLESKKGVSPAQVSASASASAAKRRQTIMVLESSSSGGDGDSGSDGEGGSGDEPHSLYGQQSGKIAGTSASDVAGTARSMLSKRQQALLQKWLQEYRKIWVSYWNHLSDQIIQGIVAKVPVTIDELATVPGVGGSRARRDGPGILATIYAFLELHDVIHLYPHAVSPSLPECPTWRDPFSEEAEIIRNHLLEHGGGGGGGGGGDNQRRTSYASNSQTQAAFSYQEGSPAHHLPGSGQKGTHHHHSSQLQDASPPTRPSSSGGGGGYGGGGSGGASYGAPLPYSSTFNPQPSSSLPVTAAGYNSGAGGGGGAAGQVNMLQSTYGISRAAPIDVTSAQKPPLPTAGYSSGYSYAGSSNSNYPPNSATTTSAVTATTPTVATPGIGVYANHKRPLNPPQQHQQPDGVGVGGTFGVSVARTPYSAAPNVPQLPVVRQQQQQQQQLPVAPSSAHRAGAPAVGAALAPYGGGFRSAAEMAAAAQGVGTGGSGGVGDGISSSNSGGSDESQQSKKARLQAYGYQGDYDVLNPADYLA